MRVADRTRIPAESLRVGPRRAAPPGREPLPRRPASRAESPSLLALRLAVHDPASVAATLSEVLFDDPIELAAYRALAVASTFHEAVEAADPDAAELLERLAVEEADAEADDVLALLVGEAANRALAEVEAEARASDDPLAAAQTIGWIKLRMEELREAARRRAALDQLVPLL